MMSTGIVFAPIEVQCNPRSYLNYFFLPFRRWFLDLVVEVTDGRILKFLETRFKAGDITANEAGQALVVAFNHLSAEPVLVALAQVSWWPIVKHLLK